MNKLPPASPLPFSPAVEKIQPDEAETHAQLVETLLKISTTTYANGHKALRSVHAKSHGLLKGSLIVPALPAVLAQGLFARPGEYAAALRFSTSPGDLLSDSVSTPRGLAIKVFGVQGERLADVDGSDTSSDTTQDFALVNGKAFLAPDAKHFLRSLKLLAGTTDKAEGLKIVLSAVLRGTEKALEAVGGESGTIKALGGTPETHILGDSFFSQVPIRYGDYIAKVGVVPTSPALASLSGQPLNLNHEHDALRLAVRSHFMGNGGQWDVRVQLCTNLDDMPVEDATVLWDEEKSPYITVATLDIPPQDSWSDPLQQSIDDAMAFNPWHGLAAHQPLGSIMRARRHAYPASARFRLGKNGCPFVEPKGI
jgi:hypothetical protein